MMAREQQSGPARRQVVKFTFFRVDPAWRRLPSEERERTKHQACTGGGATRRAIYVAREEAPPPVTAPTEAKYIFVSPFVKTRDWYKLPKETRQAMMDEHIAVGRRYPAGKVKTPS